MANCIVIILNVYIVLVQLGEIGYTFYEFSQYVQAPTDYTFKYIDPVEGTQLNENQTEAKMGIFTQTFLKSSFTEDDISECQIWTKSFNFTANSTEAGNWTYSNLQFEDTQGSLYQISQKDATILNQQSKPVFIAFQCVAILITLINLVIEYFNLEYPCCNKESIGPQGMYLLLFMCDMLLIPFYAMIGIQYGENCIEQTLMLDLFNPSTWNVMPWIQISVVILLFIVMGFGKDCRTFFIILLVFLVLISIICMISMIVTSPLYIGIPVVIKMLIELGLAKYEQGKQDSKSNSKVYDASGYSFSN